MKKIIVPILLAAVAICISSCSKFNEEDVKKTVEVFGKAFQDGDTISIAKMYPSFDSQLMRVKGKANLEFESVEYIDSVGIVVNVREPGNAQKLTLIMEKGETELAPYKIIDSKGLFRETKLIEFCQKCGMPDMEVSDSKLVKKYPEMKKFVNQLGNKLFKVVVKNFRNVFGDKMYDYTITNNSDQTVEDPLIAAVAKDSKGNDLGVKLDLIMPNGLSAGKTYTDTGFIDEDMAEKFTSPDHWDFEFPYGIPGYNPKGNEYKDLVK